MSLILTQLLKFLACTSCWRRAYITFQPKCVQNYIRLSHVQAIDSHRAFFSFFFFIHEGCLYACFFYLAYRTFHGKKRKNSILCVVNIITGPTESFDRGIMGCLLLETSK